MALFVELTLLIALAVGVGALMRLLKQPLVIGYVATGIIAAVTGLVTYQDSIEAFAQVGVALLLFLVGLSLNPKTVMETGKASIVTGLGQVLFTSVFGYFLIRALGFEHTPALYLALALTFSSTIIISKLLSDKGEIEALHGRIAIGFLIVQDLVVIIALLALSGMGSASEMAANFALLGLVVIIGFATLPLISRFMAGSQELLLLFSVGWCLAIAALFHEAGLSLEAGALTAGMALSVSPYRHEISARLRPIRDFFLLMFFVVLGAQMDFSNLSELVIPTIVLSLFILLGNPLIVLSLMGLMGYAKRTSFKAGLTVAQISEFSLILVALGVSLGHVEASILSLATAVGLVTIAASTYLILYSDSIYHRIEWALRPFERKRVKHEHKHDKHEIAIFGCNRVGFGILDTFKKLKRRFLVVEFDPLVVERLKKEGIDTIYGDAQDPALLEEVSHEHVKMVISTITHLDTNLVILAAFKRENPSAILAFVAHNADDALALYEAGASTVIIPHHDSGDHITFMVEEHGLDLERYLEERVRHVEHLKTRT